MQIKKCLHCKKEFHVKRKDKVYCSRNCKSNASGVRTGRFARNQKKARPYRKFLKDKCDFCGFIPIHNCQLDVDHKDGNNKNNEVANLQTLCANCHRLKTYQQKNWKKQL